MTFNFDEAVAGHLAAMKRKGRSEDTIDARRMFLANLRAFLNGREPTLPLLREWADAQQARGLKPRSVWSYVVHIKAFTRWCENEEITATDIGRRLEKPKLPEHLPKAYTVEEVTALLEAARIGVCRERDEAICLFLLETGARRAGVATLHLAEMNLTEGAALVTEKGDKQRPVFFGERTRRALERWLLVRNPRRFRVPDKELVFGLTPWGLGVRIADLGRQAGIHATAHKWRHTCATWRVMQSCDETTLTQLMGWTSSAMASTYATLARGQLMQRASATSPMNGFEPKPQARPLSQLPKEARRLLLRPT